MNAVAWWEECDGLPERSRSARAFDDRFAAVRDRLIGICASLVGRNEAEDLVHDSYLELAEGPAATR